MTLRIGSRGSALALWQAEWVKGELIRLGHAAGITIIKTTGDRILDSPLSAIGDKGLFTKEIEHALLQKRVDLAVHSLKDLPTALPAGLMLGAVTKREDVRDVFIAHPKKPVRRFDDLPQGAVVATGSLRRRCQLLSWRPDLRIADLRGNLNTRLARLDASEWDGMILARAGVVRLGVHGRITDTLPVERMLPAVGQGALGIEVREGDREVLAVVRKLASDPTTAAVLGERAFLRRLEGGCQVPIGTFGRLENGEFVLDAMIGSLDGRSIVRGRIRGPAEESEDLGSRLAASLADGGGREILAGIRGDAAPAHA